MGSSGGYLHKNVAGKIREAAVWIWTHHDLCGHYQMLDRESERESECEKIAKSLFIVLEYHLLLFIQPLKETF